MRYLIDTNWIASFLNGRDEARQLLTALTFAESAISIITYGEMYEGIYWGRNPQVAEQGFRQLLRALPILPLNRTIMQRYARVRGDLRSQG